MVIEAYINWMRCDRLSLNKSQGGLGFRDMEAFNLSMLGKQGWKLVHDPNFLLTRILNAKYFPRKGFLEAGIGHNPSYTGGVYGVPKILSSWAIHGKLEMGRKLIYGLSHGSDQSQHLNHPLHHHQIRKSFLSKIC